MIITNQDRINEIRKHSFRGSTLSDVWQFAICPESRDHDVIEAIDSAIKKHREKHPIKESEKRKREKTQDMATEMFYLVKEISKFTTMARIDHNVDYWINRVDRLIEKIEGEPE